MHVKEFALARLWATFLGAEVTGVLPVQYASGAHGFRRTPIPVGRALSCAGTIAGYFSSGTAISLHAENCLYVFASYTRRER